MMLNFPQMWNKRKKISAQFCFGFSHVYAQEINSFPQDEKWKNSESATIWDCCPELRMQKGECAS